MVRKPLPLNLFEPLLGAVIIPEEFLEAGDALISEEPSMFGFSSKKPPLIRIRPHAEKVRVAQSNMEIFSTDTQIVRSNSFLLDTSTSPALFGSTAVTVWQLVNVKEYFEFFIQTHRDHLKKLFADAPKTNFVLVSALLTAQPPDERYSLIRVPRGKYMMNPSECIFAFGCLEISDSLFGQLKLSQEPGGLTPTYHLPPHFELAPPPVGPLGLGSIVEDLRSLHVINSRLEIPTHQLHRHYTSGLQLTGPEMHTVKFDIWANFLSIFGVDGEAGLLSQRAKEDTYKFDRLETISFIPTQDHIRQSVEQGEVPVYIKARDFKPVYLVTGLKIARKTPIGHKPQLEPGLPASFGATTSRLNEDTQTPASEGSGDFIVGIRFKKIMFRRQFPGAKRKVVEEDFNKGAELL